MQYDEKFVGYHVKFITPNLIEVKRKSNKRFGFSLMGFVFIALYFIFDAVVSKEGINVIWLLIIGLFSLLIAWGEPNLRPVRFDRRRKLIYLWHKNKIYARSYPDWALKTKKLLKRELDITFVNYVQRSGKTSRQINHASILLDAPNRKDYVIAELGLGDSPEGDHLLGDFILDFLMSKDNTLYHTYQHINGNLSWLNLCFGGFWSRSYPKEEIVEREIQDWLKLDKEN